MLFLIMGVSLLREVQAGFYPPRYAASLTSPSPSFGHSSTSGTAARAPAAVEAWDGAEPGAWKTQRVRLTNLFDGSGQRAQQLRSRQGEIEPGAPVRAPDDHHLPIVKSEGRLKPAVSKKQVDDEDD